jgi:hypothetical protein
MNQPIVVPNSPIITPEIEAARAIKVQKFKDATKALRYRVLGMAKAYELINEQKLAAEWYLVHDALEFCLTHHTGWRKDNVTPSAMHQIALANDAMTFLGGLMFPARTIIATLLHDTPEDTPVSHAEVRDNFGAQSEEDVELMTKEYRGVKKDTAQYLKEQAGNPVTSVAKPIDRKYNLKTMRGVFKLEKQISYCDETDNPDESVYDFFDMLKEARRRFPRQELVYENLKLALRTEVELFRAAHSQDKAL